MAWNYTIYVSSDVDRGYRPCLKGLSTVHAVLWGAHLTYLYQYLQSILLSIFGAEPPGALRQQPDTNKLHDRHERLQRNWYSPRSLAVVADCTKHGPRRDDRADVPESVVHRCDLTTVLGMSKLRRLSMNASSRWPVSQSPFSVSEGSS